MTLIDKIAWIRLADGGIPKHQRGITSRSLMHAAVA
jgi:hypothetical protein